MMRRLLSSVYSLVLFLGLLSLSAGVVSAQNPSSQTLENRQPARQQTTRPRQQQQQAAAPQESQRPQIPPAEATVSLNEQFLNALLDAVFTNLRAPSFPLSLAENSPKTTIKPPKGATALAPASISQCSSQIVLEREMNGVRTAVRFENGRITAPLAFTGTYNTGLLGCLRFQGWADTLINLQFSRERQTLTANVSVVDIHLNGIPQLASGVVVSMVQSAIDQRINPVEILQASQLTTRLPISAAGGALRLRAKELRPEIIPGAVRIHIIYEFVRAD